MYDQKQGKNETIVQDDILQWNVPISIATESDPNFDNHFPKLWIPQGQALAKVDGLDTSKWIVINPDATGTNIN